MTVAELIERLKKTNPNREVVLMSPVDGYHEPILGIEPLQLVRRRTAPSKTPMGVGEYQNREARPGTRASWIDAIVIA